MTAEPTKNDATTNANQPTIAIVRWRALQRPIRPVRFVWCAGCPSDVRGSSSDESLSSFWITRVFMVDLLSFL
jgi:hypothetical protein